MDRKGDHQRFGLALIWTHSLGSVDASSLDDPRRINPGTVRLVPRRGVVLGRVTVPETRVSFQAVVWHPATKKKGTHLVHRSSIAEGPAILRGGRRRAIEPSSVLIISRL